MKINREISLTDFEFWGGGKTNAEKLSYEELLLIETNLTLMDDLNHGYSETEINDFIWFDDLLYIEWLGLSEEEWNARFIKDDLC